MDFQKYITAIELMNKVVDAAKLPVPEGGEKYTLPCIAWDELYEFIYLNFANPVSAKLENEYVAECIDRVTGKNSTEETKKSVEAEIQECQDMLGICEMNVILDKIKALPPEFTDMIFPVAIARYLLCRGWSDARGDIAINPGKLKTFNEFMNRYSTMIINSVRSVRGSK